MGLPTGFQPRACPFCGSRSLTNLQLDQDGRFRVICNFCGGVGPSSVDQDTAWVSWNGDGVKARAMFGSQQEMTV